MSDLTAGDLDERTLELIDELRRSLDGDPEPAAAERPEHLDQDENLPPTPGHVWDGSDWVLPEDHQESMLADIRDEG